tara:strand:+ start:2704 stop:4275 length:1572 start_codon:yes stop_codon:yes gene_type:complete
MRKLFFPFALMVAVLLLTIVSCKKKEYKSIAVIKDDLTSPFDSTLVQTFFEKHPKLKEYQAEVLQLYRKHQYHYVWYDISGINEFGNLLHNKINTLEEEGIENSVPYKEELDLIYTNPTNSKKPNIDTELLNSALYFYYTKTVYHGLDATKSTEMEWHLPRKKQSYVNYLDSLLTNPGLINKNEKGLIAQYFLLKKVLKKYREMEKKGGWKTISIDSTVTSYKVGDSAKVIAQIRQRLFISGDIDTDSKSAIYDTELSKAVLKYKKRMGSFASTVILQKHIKELNIPVAERIKTLTINMERCRWISNDIFKAKEFIAINIPSYQLSYFIDGKPALRLKAVVGKALNKTVIFSAPMKYIVFSPYWNVPKSILDKEILPGIEKNENYLVEHDMEWYNNSVRQKPGPKNSLGLIKFLFPNSNDIYLHDTPSKSLFNREDRAFSHGCIRIQNPNLLAETILRNYTKWDAEKIDSAMNSGVESWYTLKNKIPVYIGYFTAWVDEDNTVHFYEDVYKRDEALASLLFVK